jgi:hypothetical protein
MAEGTGKRKKEFCDETCRSNFWYAKNKKGKSEKSERKITFVTPTPDSFFGEKLPSNFTHDEPLSFEKLKQQIIPQPYVQYKTVPQYMKWKREIDTEEEFQKLCAEVDANPTLTHKEKIFCKTANPSQL